MSTVQDDLTKAADANSVAAEAAVNEIDRLSAVQGIDPIAVGSLIDAAEVGVHTDVEDRFDALRAAVALLETSEPPIEPPPVDPPDPPPDPTGFMEIGGSAIGGPNGLVREGPSLSGHLPDAASAYWQEILRPVVQDEVDPNSDHLMARIGNANIHIDFFGKGYGDGRIRDDNGNVTANTGGPIYGIPYNIVRGDTARVAMAVTGYADQSDVVTVPMPTNPSIEGWPSASPPSSYGNNDDHHCLIYVRNETTGAIEELFEIASPVLNAGKWSCAQLSWWGIKGNGGNSGATLAVDGKPRRDGWTGSTAGSIPRMPQMATYDEVMSGAIHHPLCITLNVGAQRNRYQWPARHGTNSGSNTDGLSYGARLRLKLSEYDRLKAMPQFAVGTHARVFLDCLRNYGLINDDIGGMGFLTGISDDRFNNDDLMNLQLIPMPSFEVCKIVPQFELVGPATIQVGVNTVYTPVFNPPIEPNGAHGYYFHCYEPAPGGLWQRLPDDGTGGVQPHEVDYSTTDKPDVTTITVKARKVGPLLIEMDQAGEMKLEWRPPEQFQTTTDGTRFYPCLHVTVTP